MLIEKNIFMGLEWQEQEADFYHIWLQMWFSKKFS